MRMTAVLEPMPQTRDWPQTGGPGHDAAPDAGAAASQATQQRRKTRKPAANQAAADSPSPGRPSPDSPSPDSPAPDSNVSSIGDMTRSRRARLLTRVVESEILPRLVQARAGGDYKAAEPVVVTTRIDSDELVRLLLTREAEAAIAFVEVFRMRGTTTSSLYLGIITDAARILGELWEDDRCDFTQVTVGLGRLQQLVRALSPNFQKAAVTHAHPDTVLLLPAPGDQHTLGLVILSEFFQREGWHVAGGPASTARDAEDLVRDIWVDVAGFSVGSTSRLDSVTSLIRAVRRVSRNRDIGVMVGGPLFLHQPDLVARVGADIGAADAQAAVRQASGLIAMRTAAD